ncbi:UNVERIFIED_CONTAM: Translocase of chloroplast, chloroplastic [Sesamum latifolium]|uniref:Translocase of chloroplast, chloroplastic n=1 Tax=Sesamum latifolium TaxID=2727402 RepID=A0AAW2WND0_9LAMI
MGTRSFHGGENVDSDIDLDDASDSDKEEEDEMTQGDADSGAAALVAVPLPDMALPPSFDSERYRFLERTSQFLARPVLDSHGWDHDCRYDGVNLEHSLAIANRFPLAYTVQITKDKKELTISLDSSISTKHGENKSSMAGFDIRSMGKQLAYIVRAETKFKNLKKNRVASGLSFTFLGENVVPGVKIVKTKAEPQSVSLDLGYCLLLFCFCTSSYYLKKATKKVIINMVPQSVEELNLPAYSWGRMFVILPVRASGRYFMKLYAFILVKVQFTKIRSVVLRFVKN